MPLVSGQEVERLDRTTNLKLARCPHCRIADPLLLKGDQRTTQDHAGKRPRFWLISSCQSCGGLVVAGSPYNPANGVATGTLEVYPSPIGVSDSIPETPRRFLEQAQNTLHAPDAAVMVAASAVDAMLKAKNLKNGSLYSRIDLAVTNHILTKDMAAWAHQVRLDANDARHADEENPHHDVKSASSAVEFATALAEFLFVLPARVTRGIVAAGGTPPKEEATEEPKAKL